MEFENVAMFPEMEIQPAAQVAGYLPRSRYMPLALLPGTLFCGLSWIFGGVPRLTDLGFVLFSLACLVLLIAEIAHFPRRYGVGGIILFGGALVWLSHDYFANWFGSSFTDATYMVFRASVVAKAAYFNCLFVGIMSIGLLIQRGRWMQRIIMSMPEPNNPNFYFWLMIGMQCIGIGSFAVFAKGSFLVAVAHVWTAPFFGQGVDWTVGRSGNLNYNWGGYVSQLLQIGQTGGVVAAVYALLVARRMPLKILAWTIWAFWVFFGYSGGRRGEMVFMFLPVAFLLYLKYQALASGNRPRHSLRAYITAGTVIFVLLVIVQFEGTYRDTGLSNGELSAVNLTASQGNTMFSEGLPGWALIPDQQDYYYDRLPGEAAVRLIPDQIVNFFVGAFPRALWPNKPVDPVWEWYNVLVTHDASGRVGTTISTGLAGHWYFRYGLAGIVEGGLLMGWILAVSERALQESAGRPMTILLSLGIMTWLFRCFRDFIYIDLYGLLIGAAAFALLCKIVNQVSGPPAQVVEEY
jgi:hypothetical protein